MKKLLKRLDAILQRIFKTAKHLINLYTVPSIEVVQLLKKLMDSGLPARIAEATPTKIDDWLVAKLQVAIPKVLISLNLANCYNQYADPNDIIACAVDQLKKLDPAGKRSNYIMIAANIMYDLADGKISWSECVRAVQNIWDLKYSQSLPVAA